jgi:hypothetical protein
MALGLTFYKDTNYVDTNPPPPCRGGFHRRAQQLKPRRGPGSIVPASRTSEPSPTPRVIRLTHLLRAREKARS